MYITQEIASRIKSTAKSKKIKMSELLSDCELNINAISEFSKGKQLSCISFAKIADRLDCSVDYLLGRVDNQNDTYSISNHNSVVNGTQANVINNSQNNTDSLLEEFLQKFEQLDFDDKLDVMQYVKNKKQEV